MNSLSTYAVRTQACLMTTSLYINPYCKTFIFQSSRTIIPAVGLVPSAVKGHIEVLLWDLSGLSEENLEDTQYISMLGIPTLRNRAQAN